MKYGLLSYGTQNVGDFIQSLAARKFLPQIDQYIDREHLDEVALTDSSPIKLIMNGWFCHRPDKWPPASGIEPLLISMHITNNPEPDSGMRAREVFAQRPEALRYLRRNGPVGARDYFTLEWLKSHDIECYYSGCLTLTLDRPPVAREDFIVLNDLPDAVEKKIGQLTGRPLERTTHADFSPVIVAERMEQAEALITRYARAACVVTSQLHGAIPCLAMGTPTLMIDTSWDQSRFAGLNELVEHCSAEDFLAGKLSYDFEDPPANRQRHFQLREDLERRVRAFVG